MSYKSNITFFSKFTTHNNINNNNNNRLVVSNVQKKANTLVKECNESLWYMHSIQKKRKKKQT